MLFCVRVLYCTVLAHIASTELILKIDLNETTDKRSTANYIYITFVNTTDSEHMAHGKVNVMILLAVENYLELLPLIVKPDLFNIININIHENLTNKNITLNINEDKENLNGIHQLVNRNPENAPMHVSFNIEAFKHIIPSRSHIKIPVVQWKGDTSNIKKHLDEFKMNKKRTYVSTPHYNFAFKRTSKFETGFEKENFRRKYIPKEISQLSRENELFDIISKQNKLIEKIAKKVLETEKRKKKIVRTVFDDIIESVEARQNKTKATANVTTTTTTEPNNKLSTVLTIIDETEIRNALKKDPFVNRILRMAAKKKEEYEAKKRTEQDFIS